MRSLLIAASLLFWLPNANATLYQKVNDQFVLMSAQDEAAARADPSNLFGNDSGFPVLISKTEADQIKATWAAGPAPEQAFNNLLNGGLAITYTGCAACSATYAADKDGQESLTSIVTSIAVGQGLPNGAGTITFLDRSHAPHSLTATQITVIGAAVRDFVYNARITRATLLAGGSTPWPSTSVTVGP